MCVCVCVCVCVWRGGGVKLIGLPEVDSKVLNEHFSVFSIQPINAQGGVPCINCMPGGVLVVHSGLSCCCCVPVVRVTSTMMT